MSHNPPFQQWDDPFLHIYRGIVRNITDPDQAGRIQVEIWPMFFNINAVDLPWAIPATNIFEGSGTGTGTFAVPQVGALVWCFFEEGNYYQPVYFAEAPDLIHGIPPEALVNYPNRKVWKTVSGISMIFDNIALTWSIYDPNGMCSIIDLTGQRLAQTGDVKFSIQTQNHSGWLIANGATIGNTNSSATYTGPAYQALFNMLNGTGWTSGGVVALPDVRGRSLVAIDNMGGTDANVLTNTYTPNRNTLLGNVGEEAHTLIDNELPGDINFMDHTGTSYSYILQINPTGTTVRDVTPEGLAHNTVQPGIMMYCFIKI